MAPLSLGLVFLDPLAGILAGAIAGPALLLLYFLKLRRRPLRISSTMLWERAAEDLQVNAPVRWLRFTWTLLLQALALALLCGALARPAIVDPDAPPPGRIVLLLDRSASMQSSDGGEEGLTRFDAARARAARLVRRMELTTGVAPGAGGNEAMLVGFADEPVILAPLSSDRGLLLDAIERATPTDQPGDLSRALRLASAFIAAGSDDPDAVGGTIVLLSDGSFEDGLVGARAAAGSAVLRLERVGPEPGEPRDNLGIVALSARRDEREPTRVRVFVRVQNSGAEAVRTTCVLRLDGEPVRSVEFEAPGAAAERPGEATLSIDVQSPGAATLSLTLPRDDVLAADNSAWAALDAPVPPRVVLVAPGPPNADLREALELLAPGAVRAIDARTYESLRADGRFEADLVVFDRVRPETPPDAPSLSVGAGMPVPGLDIRGADALPPTRVLSWRRTHPLLRDVVLDPLIVGSPLAFEPASRSEAAEIEPLAQGDGGPLIVVRDDAVAARIVVAFDVGRSNWASDVSFPVFIANVVERLGGTGGRIGRWIRTTSTSLVQAEPGADALRAVGPVTLEAPATPGGPTPIGPFPLAGLYRVEGAVQRDATIAVNLASPHESEARTEALPGDEDASADPLAAGSAGRPEPREIWPWFVLAAAALLTLEWALYAWRMRV